MSRPSWDEVWLATAMTIAKRSKCDRAQVGAVIVSMDNRMAASSYNGPPPQYSPTLRLDYDPSHCNTWCPRACKGEGEALDPMYADCPSVHAEANAIARSTFADTKGGTIYVTSQMCMHCAKAVAAAQISRVVFYVPLADETSHRNPDAVREFLEDSDVDITLIRERNA